MEADCGWGGPSAPSVCLLFRDARAIPALLEFLEDTRVGRMPGWVLLASGLDLNEDEIEEVELRAPEEKEDRTSVRAVRRRMGQANPPRSCFSFVFPLFSSVKCVFSSFSFVRRYTGRRRTGTPHYDCASWSGVVEGVI